VGTGQVHETINRKVLLRFPTSSLPPRAAFGNLSFLEDMNKIVAKRIEVWRDMDAAPMYSRSERDEEYLVVRYEYLTPAGYMEIADPAHTTSAVEVVDEAGKHVAWLGKVVYVSMGSLFQSEEEALEATDEWPLRVPDKSPKLERLMAIPAEEWGD
jgi:hypothetical protein